MAPAGERTPRVTGEGGRRRGGGSGRGGRGEGDTRGYPSPSGEGDDADSTVPKPNAKPAAAAKHKKSSKTSAARRAIAAERARVEAAVAEEAARAEAAKLAAEARRVAAETEATRARELLAEEKQRAARARARRNALRATNADVTRRWTEDDLKRLDSSIKKNTALTKKLGKTIGAETLDGLAHDVASTNASKYVAENARAVAMSATIKSSPGDIAAAAELVSALHRMYFPEFGEALGHLLCRAICPDAPEGAFANLAGKEKRSEKARRERDEGLDPARSRGREAPEDSAAIVASTSDSPAQRRAKLRLLAEAHLVGAVASAKPVFAAVTELIRSATEARRERDDTRFAHVLGSLAAFAKAYGEAYVREEEDVADDTPGDDTPGGAYRLSPERRGAFRDALRSFHVAASVALLDERRAARDAQRETKATLARTGELSESLTLRVAELERSCESLRKNLEVLTEALGGEARGVRVPPDADDDAAEAGKPKGDVRLSRGVDASGASRRDAASWDDEATRAFYESLPALRETVPRGLLPPEPPARSSGAEGSSLLKASAGADAEPPRTEPPETAARLAELDARVTSRLRCCDAWTGVADADAFAADFCYFAAGPVARRLVADAFVAAIERASLGASDAAAAPTALLARALATLASASAAFDAEIAAPAIDATRASVERYYLRDASTPRADARDAERRLGMVRFTGECVKFRVLDAEWAFTFLKKTTETFAGPSLDAACALLQTCGRYLARRRDTAARAHALLDVFLRRKAVSAERLEAGQSELVDATCLACRPPPVAARRRRRRHPTRAYVAFVVDRLCREWQSPPPEAEETSPRGGEASAPARKASRGENTVASRGDASRASDDAVRRCVRQLRKVTWAEHGRYAVTRLLKGATRSGRVESATAVARAVATLDRFRDDAARRYADALLEETAVLSALDDARKERFAQRRVALGRALGEAFVARLVPASAVYAQLYALLDETRPSRDEAKRAGDGVDGPSASASAALALARRVDRRVRVRAALAILAACRPRLAPSFRASSGANPRDEDETRAAAAVTTAVARVARREARVSFETRRYLTYFRRFAFFAGVAASPELSAELRATLAAYLGPGDEAFAFDTFADADAACARLEAEERARRERARGASAGPEASAAGSRAAGDESDSGGHSEAERDDDGGGDFEDSGSDVGDADDAGMNDAVSDAAVDSDSTRLRGGDDDSEDDASSDASRGLDASASASASESDASESDASSARASSDDAFDDDSEDENDATFASDRSGLPVASREDKARFEREMASFLGPNAPPKGDRTDDAFGTPPIRRGGDDAVAASRASATRPATVAFKALVRRDGRPTAAMVGVPEDTSFVVRAREKRAAEARERAELKRLVLASAEAVEEPETDPGAESGSRETFTVFSSATFSRVPGRGRGARGFAGGDRRG